MSSFSSKTTATVAEPDPTKHVNYNVGMVLGVDDFTQEFAYLSGRDQWMARDLIGYGTVRGLKVAVDVDAGKGPRVVVEPGVAVSPRGQLICVPGAQCAYLNDWLAEHKNDLPGLMGSPPANKLQLFIVLCYRDCPTDNVPIAGEPCRSEDQLTAPSRLIDNFSLELRFKKPNQREENAVRDFVDWLKKVEVNDAFIASTPLEQFLQAIRDAAKVWLAAPLTSPPASPPASPPSDFLFGSPPAFMHLRSADACAYWRAAFRLWVTELRPKWIARWHGCAATHFAGDDATEEECVMLAELSVPILPASPGNFVVANFPAVAVNEEQRPYVIHLRMLQEWLLCGATSPALGSPPGGGLQGPPGKDGTNGKNGTNGKDGKDGTNGKDGKDGQDGKDGKDATGDFVERPAGLPRYAIVAAGMVKGDSTSRGPVYGDLKASVGPNGEFILNFKGYKVPDTKFQYIVKVLVAQANLAPPPIVVTPAGVLRTPVVLFRSFQQQGILLSIIDGGTPVPPQTAQLVELMVEISRFESA